MLKLNHKNLEIWKKRKELVKEVYRITNGYPIEEKFGLVSQMRKAVVSIMSNLSEGAARKSENERNRFYEISRSSLVELDTQVEISIELKYLDIEETTKTAVSANEVFAMLSGMMRK